MSNEEAYCEAQVGGMECGRPVHKWNQQCSKHDPEGITVLRKPCPYCNDDGVACDMAGEVVADPCWCVKEDQRKWGGY